MTIGVIYRQGMPGRSAEYYFKFYKDERYIVTEEMEGQENLTTIDTFIVDKPEVLERVSRAVDDFSRSKNRGPESELVKKIRQIEGVSDIPKLPTD